LSEASYRGGVKHITISDKSFLIGDEVADLLVRYAALLGKIHSADSVRIRAIGIDGEAVDADFLLNSGTVLMAESSRSQLPEPDNGDAVEYMRERIAAQEDFELPESMLDDTDSGVTEEG
jgi:hypothetical protein